MATECKKEQPISQAQCSTVGSTPWGSFPEGTRVQQLRPTPAAAAAGLLQDHYPWFLPTYLAYPYHIQRVDAIRYFLLYHYGGVYIDLDMGCRKRLDFMRQYNFTAPLTHPGGISNDVLAAAPGATYLHRALGQLRRWNKFMLIKYIQVGGWLWLLGRGCPLQ